MPPTTEIEVDAYHDIGPIPNVYGHGMVLIMDSALVICLDCGAVVDNVNLLSHKDCDHEQNGIKTPLREWVAAETDDVDEWWPTGTGEE